MGIFGGSSSDSDTHLDEIIPDSAILTAYAEYINCPKYDALPSAPSVYCTSGNDISADEIRALCRSETLVSALQLASQLGRNSENVYAMLSKVFTAPKLVWILSQLNPTVRAKCCNLVGNLCRYCTYLNWSYVRCATLMPHTLIVFFILIFYFF